MRRTLGLQELERYVMPVADVFWPQRGLWEAASEPIAKPTLLSGLSFLPFQIRSGLPLKRHVVFGPVQAETLVR